MKKLRNPWRCTTGFGPNDLAFHVASLPHCFLKQSEVVPTAWPTDVRYPNFLIGFLLKVIATIHTSVVSHRLSPILNRWLGYIKTVENYFLKLFSNFTFGDE